MTSVIQRTLSGKIPVRGQFGWRTDERGMKNNVHYTPEMLEEIRRINELGFRTDVDLPQWEQEFQQTTDANEDIPLCRDKKEHYEPRQRAVSDTDLPNIIPAD